jgi:hypothetical protein
MSLSCDRDLRNNNNNPHSESVLVSIAQKSSCWKRKRR